MLFADLVEVSRAVASTSGRLEKIARLAELLRRTSRDELPVVVAYLSGGLRQGRIGVGYALVATARETPPASAPTLDVRDVDAAFDRVASAGGPGSAGARAELLKALFSRATSHEQDFLARLLFGELRQGAVEGVLLEAIARAANIPAASVRRGAMLGGDLAGVAMTALFEGADALSRFVVQPFTPLQPMLADSASDVAEALDELGEASFEYKLDGARIQVHKAAGEVRVYSRNLRDVTAAVPEVVDVVRAMPAESIILDGEVIALRPDRTPHPFQVTMRRFGRKLDVDRLKQDLPLTPFFFDALFVDGAALVDDPLARRVIVLGEQASSSNIVPRIVTASADAAADFTRRALAAGHEGVMAKAVDGAYAAGRRGQAWLKVKQARTLDLVILAAEWGSGRRQGTLSNLHLGARDADRGGFVMLGKTFKGLTDEMLAWQTKKLLELEIGRDGRVVFVRPELVAEIAFNEIQASPQYPGGVALRFARVKGYRVDKSAAEADTIGTVLKLFHNEYE